MPLLTGQLRESWFVNSLQPLHFEFELSTSIRLGFWEKRRERILSRLKRIVCVKLLNMIEQDEYRCFIGNLSWSTSDRDLKEAFKKFDHLVDAKVVVDRSSGRSRGFGFVTFDDEKAMEDAIEAMNGIDLDGRPISVDKAQPNQGGGRDRDSGRDRDRDRDRGRDRGRDRDYGGGGRGSGGGGDCFKCGKPGHFARECPSGEGSRGGSRKR
ncbi:hypothetical protein L6452_38959 [Arctium lappa]|uniref:Uncharacterized protein n=1 Tax=Arctium lappa TaxID=4217 RepID=A0ACB8XS59_ARCLA|nr:hypothetical protein L6452_38959 [Arctium lappa]